MFFFDNSTYKFNDLSLVTNSGPKDHALISRRIRGGCSHVNNGIMEWWKNGILGMKNG